jgi:hypothetical protein
MKGSIMAGTTKRKPWEMTREEWFQDAEAVRTAVGDIAGKGYIVKYKYCLSASTRPFVGETILPEKPRKGTTIRAIFGYAVVTSASKNMRKTQMDNQQLRDAGIAYHKQAVQEAAQAGLDIARAVLEEYKSEPWAQEALTK